MSQVAERSHPILAALATANGALDSVSAVDPLFMRTSEVADALEDVLALEARTAEIKARLVVALDQSGDEGTRADASDLPFWLAQQARIGIKGSRDLVRFARRLATHPVTAAALAAGEVSAEQAGVIMAAVEALPADLPPDLVADLATRDADGADVATRAEAHLLGDAARFSPRELTVLGRRILEVVAPDIADEAEARKLEAAERRARARVRLVFTPLRDGTTRISGRLPDLAATTLASMLDSLVNPRRTPPWADQVAPATNEPGPPKPWWAMPAPHKLGYAFIELIERFPADVLPVHGNTTTSLLVTVTLDQLRTGLGAAVVAGPHGEDLISAAQARRLACTATLIPAVLGTASEVLDLGRTARLFSPAQTRALRLRHRHCQGRGCDQPATHCEAHHHISWLDGGPTDLSNALLLCNRCHHRAHDPCLTYQVADHGEVVFTRVASPP